MFKRRRRSVQAVRHSGTAASTDAIREWIATGLYTDPGEPDDAAGAYFVLIGDEEVRPGQWIVETEENCFAIFEQDMFEALYEPSPKPETRREKLVDQVAEMMVLMDLDPAFDGLDSDDYYTALATHVLAKIAGMGFRWTPEDMTPETLRMLADLPATPYATLNRWADELESSKDDDDA